MIRFIENIVVKLITFLLLAQTINFAQKATVPLDMQWKVVPKILTLNKNFAEIDTFRSTIIYSQKQRQSTRIYDEFRMFSKKTNGLFKRKVVEFYSINLENISKLREHLIENKINMIYITPMRGVDVEKITDICAELNVLSITGVEEYLESNVAVIMTLEDKKLKIIVNLKQAKAEGVDFSSRLLNIARVIR